MDGGGCIGNNRKQPSQTRSSTTKREIIMKRVFTLSVAVLIAAASTSWAEDAPSATPKAVPATRPEMKIALEALKDRMPRLPLAPSEGRGVNNGRMRSQYLPASWSGGGGGGGRNRGRQPNNAAGAIDYAFTTSMFWVVSRGNNCHYCLGHQELKLKSAGLDDDTIAALDSDWSRFDSRMQAALAYTRKLTLEPQLMGEADIAALKKLFTDAEIAELTISIARYNATNRWTDGLGIPQDRAFNGDGELVTPTSEKFRITTSVATPNTRAARPPLPTAEEFARGVAAARIRKPRIALAMSDEARTGLAEVIGDREPLAWEQLMAAAGSTSQVRNWNTIQSDENLPPRLKAELALTSAVHNRAWYAAAHAAQRLADLGVSPAEIDTLAMSDVNTLDASGPAAARALAAKSTANPHLVTDADIASVRNHYSDAETAMIMHVICMSNLFDRVTEPLGLPLEAGIAAKSASRRANDQ
jgi:alkylhydroperoxidase family enzyme